MSIELRKATFEYKVPEATADSMLTQMKTGTRVDEANRLPSEMIYSSATILENAPVENGYRIIEVVYEATNR